MTSRTSTEIKQELVEAEREARREREAAARAKRQAERAATKARVTAYREENYEASAGAYDSWLGLGSGYKGNVEITTHEYDRPQNSVILNREDAIALRDSLNVFIGE